MAKQAFHSSSSSVLILYWFVSTFCRALKRKYLLLSDLLFPDKKRQNSKEFFEWNWCNKLREEFPRWGIFPLWESWYHLRTYFPKPQGKQVCDVHAKYLKKVLSEIVHIIFKTTPETQEMQNFYFTFTFYSAL